MNKMNKLLITSAIAYSMASTNASSLFIQVDGSSTKIKSILGSDITGISKPKFTLTDKNTATARLTLGITEDNRTVSLDYTHFNTVKDRLSNSHISAETEAKGFSVDLQGRLQHDIGRFSPYIGLRTFYTELDYNYPLNIYNHNGDETQQMSFNAGLRVNC